MAKIKSVPTFLRKQLKVKGATEHNGRGCYDMEFECDTKELQSAVYTRLGQWKEQGLVESSTFDEKEARIEFKMSVCHLGCYRTVVIYFNAPSARVFY